MHKLMWRFVTTTKKKKIPDRNLDTSCPAGIPCNKWDLQLAVAHPQSSYLFIVAWWAG